ncbi:MAG: type II toxin-antitoxin system VapC family toxin [Kineosporiaceae bacterium]
MTVVLDAGALVAVDRGARESGYLVALARREPGIAVTVAPVVTQVWRDGARQARLARFLSLVDVRPVDEDTARRAGGLLAAAGTSDAVDALLVDAAGPGDTIVTGDGDDIERLVRASGRPVTVARV